VKERCASTQVKKAKVLYGHYFNDKVLKDVLIDFVQNYKEVFCFPQVYVKRWLLWWLDCLGR